MNNTAILISNTRFILQSAIYTQPIIFNPASDCCSSSSSLQRLCYKSPVTILEYRRQATLAMHMCVIFNTVYDYTTIFLWCQ